VGLERRYAILSPRFARFSRGGSGAGGLDGKSGEGVYVDLACHECPSLRVHSFDGSGRELVVGDFKSVDLAFGTEIGSQRTQQPGAAPSESLGVLAVGGVGEGAVHAAV